jgi:hypothetical protein
VIRIIETDKGLCHSDTTPFYSVEFCLLAEDGEDLGEDGGNGVAELLLQHQIEDLSS